ncbi:helix-turn-helix transcriptional regulator [Nonomuraea sp. NPDC002799]
MDTRERMLALLALLQTGREWSASDLSKALETSPRTLRRDLQRLDELGYPVASSRGPGGHYTLTSGTALPPLMLSDTEAIATMLGLQMARSGAVGIDFDHRAMDSALDKIRRMLPSNLRKQADQIDQAVTIAETVQHLPEAALFRVVTEAIQRHRQLTFHHRNGDGDTVRTVEPLRLVNRRSRWYLIAWDTIRADWRTFRLDRIRQAHLTTETFQSRKPPTDDLPAWFDDMLRTPRHRIAITLHAGLEDALARLHRVDGTLTPIGPHRTRYHAEVDSFEWLTSVLILSGLAFTVESPQNFAHYIGAAAERLSNSVTCSTPQGHP